MCIGAFDLRVASYRIVWSVISSVDPETLSTRLCSFFCVLRHLSLVSAVFVVI